MGSIATPLEVEIARTAEQRERGLMFRRALGEDAGMLFVFSSAAPRAFWMRDTCIPLDILFLDGDGRVVGILENVPTMNDESREVACPARYVLEVNAGWSRRHGATVGMRVELPKGVQGR